MTANELPDIFDTPWPETSTTGIHAARQGDWITVKTGWKNYLPNDSVAMCSDVIGDLDYAQGLTVSIYGGAKNDILLAWNVGSGKCHDLGNHD